MSIFSVVSGHDFDCHCKFCNDGFWKRVQKKDDYKRKALRKTDRWLESRNREWRKGWKDSYRDTAGPWLDRTVVGMFMIGAVATAIGLI